MTRVDARRYLQIALDSALAAGPIALEYFRKPIVVDDKRKAGRYDPVTEADRGIETFLRDRLRAACPGHGIVGEEHGREGQGTTYWVIDPIDGTRAFISGMPTWGILLGLVHDGQPLVGVMHQPFTGESWYAARGSGARYRRHAEETVLRTRADATLADAVLYSTHPSMFIDVTVRERYDDLATHCRLQRWGGDCYAFALVAQGGIDIMVDASLAPYDILPLVPIIEEAGGKVSDLDGRTPLEGGTVIAAASTELHAAALAVMRGRGA
jgi:histidinol phosphatase-like enzyme (inositol monophosphatase family)